MFGSGANGRVATGRHGTDGRRWIEEFTIVPDFLSLSSLCNAYTVSYSSVLIRQHACCCEAEFV